MIHFRRKRDFRGIVIVRLIFVVRQPEFLDGHPDIRIVRKTKPRKILDPGVGQINRGQNEDVRRAGRPGFVVRVVIVPEVQSFRAADVLRPDKHLIWKATLFGNLLENRRDGQEVAMVGRKNPLASDNRRWSIADHLPSRFWRGQRSFLTKCRRGSHEDRTG
jgi:hypothetical protein